MKERKKTLFIFVLLLLVGVTSGYIANTYARYASKFSPNNGTATVAKWNFKKANETQSFKVNVAGSADITTLSEGKIAPGASGSLNLKLVNTETETGVDFTVTFRDIPSLPSDLKLYADAAKTTSLTDGYTITGQLKALDSTGVDIPIYWEWPLGGSTDPTESKNVSDTTAGENASTLTFTVDITGVQVAPSESEIESKVNPA